MVTGFDILTHDRRLRRHWLRRSGAFIADALMVFIPVTLILWFLEITDIIVIGFITSLVFYFSSAIMEAALGATAGKLILGMRVRSLKSQKVSARAFLRNLNRLLWFVLPPLDFALGMATRGDPRQRIFDRAAGTTVTIESEREWHEAHLDNEPMPTEGEAEEGTGSAQQEARTKEGEPAVVEAAEDGAGSGEEQPPKMSGNGDKCHECGGHLRMLADEKLQCTECGLIQ